MDHGVRQRPKAVVIIRHAEKNVDEHGDEIEGDTQLSAEGVKRAEGLAASFLLASGPIAPVLSGITGRAAKDPLFDAIYAMKQNGKKHSDRPRLTVLPYAQTMIRDHGMKNADFHRYGALGTGAKDGDRDQAFAKGEEVALVAHINAHYSGKVVLVCWEHKAITEVRTRL